MNIRFFLLLLVLIGFITGVFQANTTIETIIWFIVGVTGLLGVATFGFSSKHVLNHIKTVITGLNIK